MHEGSFPELAETPPSGSAGRSQEPGQRQGAGVPAPSQASVEPDLTQRASQWSVEDRLVGRAGAALSAVNVLLKATPFCCPITTPLRDGRTGGEEPPPVAQNFPGGWR